MKVSSKKSYLLIVLCSTILIAPTQVSASSASTEGWSWKTAAGIGALLVTAKAIFNVRLRNPARCKKLEDHQKFQKALSESVAIPIPCLSIVAYQSRAWGSTPSTSSVNSTSQQEYVIKSFNTIPDAVATFNKDNINTLISKDSEPKEFALSIDIPVIEQTPVYNPGVNFLYKYHRKKQDTSVKIHPLAPDTLKINHQTLELDLTVTDPKERLLLSFSQPENYDANKADLKLASQVIRKMILTPDTREKLSTLYATVQYQGDQSSSRNPIYLAAQKAEDLAKTPFGPKKIIKQCKDFWSLD